MVEYELVKTEDLDKVSELLSESYEVFGYVDGNTLKEVQHILNSGRHKCNVIPYDM